MTTNEHGNTAERAAALASELLEVAREAAQAGADVLLRAFSRGVTELETKSSGTDMVSEADLNSERSSPLAARATLCSAKKADWSALTVPR